MDPTQTASEEAIQAVTSSYGRCCLKPEFFDQFYQNFLDADPRLAPMFANTDMAKQKQLLRQGISYLIQFAKGSTIASRKIDELAKSHNKDHFNIKPTLYPLWTSALLKTIEGTDPKLDVTLRSHWQQVLAVGIEAMKTGYNAPAV